MLAGEQKQVRHPRRRVLEAISEGLREIEACFELFGFSASEEESTQEEPSQEESKEEEQEEDYEDDYGEDEYSEEPAVYQREDIEVAIDLFISHLVREKVIREIKRGGQPSLVGIFERIFGEGHEIIEKVRTFEEHIEGYFGAIGPDDMNSAYGELSEIRNIIKTEMDRHAEN